MKKMKWLIFLPILAILVFAAFSSTPTPESIIINGSRDSEGVSSGLEVIQAEPTQTPYIIYVVVTATPEPAPAEEEIQIIRPVVEQPQVITIANPTAVPGSVQTNNVVNVPATSGGAVQTGIGCTTANSDGSTCTMSFEIVSGPTYGNGSKVAYKDVFWNQWVIRNTGTCTWGPDWSFVFNTGWQIGNTRFYPTKSKYTVPGDTLTVSLGLTADLEPGRTYYSTYIMESPSGVQCGTITTTFDVVTQNYFKPTPVVKPNSGWSAGPHDPWWHWDPWCPWCSPKPPHHH